MTFDCISDIIFIPSGGQELEGVRWTDVLVILRLVRPERGPSIDEHDTYILDSPIRILSHVAIFIDFATIYCIFHFFREQWKWKLDRQEAFSAFSLFLPLVEG